MSRSLDSVADIARWRLCVGCGACASVCPGQSIRLVIDDPARCGDCRACLDVCPGYELDYSAHAGRRGALPALAAAFGPVLEIWEGHARDPAIRFAGSSGGILTALSLFGLEKRGMHGVLHIGSDPADPLRNRTGLSRTRAELLARSGSRYAPASACDSLRLIEESPGACIFIGQPAEVAALRKAQRLRPLLDRRVGLALSFFCAGSPSTQGTIDLLATLGIARSGLASLRYRGEGWPGSFTAARPGSPEVRLTYAQSWGFLQKYRPYAVHLWPDDTGEAADISCGDPWYSRPAPGAPGSSLVVVRTELGRRELRGAMDAGCVDLVPAEPWKLVKSQENLIRKKRAIAGRRLAFRAFGLPLTRLRGFSLPGLWLGLSPVGKFNSIFGTARRIVQRKYFLPAGQRVRRGPRALSARGAIASLIAIALLGLACLRCLYPFLAVTHRVASTVLVIDGWLPTHDLGEAAAEYHRGDYRTVLAVRGVYPLDGEDRDRPLDDYVADVLLRHGIPRERLNSVLYPGLRRDRTFTSALAVRLWFAERHLPLEALNLATTAAHARRSRLLYREALGSAVAVGVVALDDPAYDGSRWWRSSEGVREVLFEGAAYLYVRLFFTPARPADLRLIEFRGQPAASSHGNSARIHLS